VSQNALAEKTLVAPDPGQIGGPMHPRKGLLGGLTWKFGGLVIRQSGWKARTETNSETNKDSAT
jgi:hypothetical protein